MCGIVGIASGKKIEIRGWLTTARDTISHRGPDDSGEWWSSNGHIGLGHRRLSILDLSSTAHQPMQNINGKLTIVFNGEIYNHDTLRKDLIKEGLNFRSHSDTEVILNAYQKWGTNCLAYLQGMFAFALYDAEKNELFIARDRAGEKPLFYLFDNSSIKFSSELKGLMADPTFSRKIDLTSLNFYLDQGYISGDKCILEKVKKLPAAHAMVFNVTSAQLHIWRYWQLPKYQPLMNTVNEHVLLDELEELLESSVRRQLSADVSVGVLLSGGIDSSLITAMAARNQSKVKTFNVSFPGFEKYDEARYAKLISEHFGTEHMELIAESSSIDLLPALAKQFDEPIIDSSMIPTYLVSRLVRQHCKVAIGGDGGDELFGGYKHYNRLLWLEKNFSFIPHSLRCFFLRHILKYIPLGTKGYNWLNILSKNFKHELPLVANYYNLDNRRKLFSINNMALNIHRERISENNDLLEDITRADFKNYLAEDILVKVDRASMLASLEVRAPMLDVRIIEFAFSKVPSSLKASTTSRKLLLKKLAARILPSSFDAQRKQGFSIPLNIWLQSGIWLKYFREILLDYDQKLFDHSFIEQLFDWQSKGYNNSEKLFGLVIFELWRKEYNIDIHSS